MKPGIRQQQIASKGYFCLSILLIVYVACRSAAVGFTHDESLSYTIIRGNDSQVFTANNHWLNTALMYLFSKIFGYSEPVLRLPNVISFIVYLWFIHRIFREFCVDLKALVISAPLLLLNPFMLDFFGLARGYGLGMCFFTVSLYYFLAYFTREQSPGRLAWMVISGVCCVYANYAFLTAVLALHGASLICCFRVHREKWMQLGIFYLAEATLLVPAILNILFLSEKNELYAGGERHVFHDTLKSVISFSYSYGDDVAGITLVVCAVMGIALLAGMMLLRNRALDFMKILVLLLIVIPTVLHYAIGMNYPKDRAAIYWMIVTGIFVLLAAGQVWRTYGNLLLRWIFVTVFGALTVFQVINFILNFSLDQTIIWKYDSDVKNAMTLVRKNLGDKESSIGINWLLEPSVNYYRETKHIDRLKPATRDGVAAAYDYYLVFGEDLPQLAGRRTETIRHYPSSDLYLVGGK